MKTIVTQIRQKRLMALVLFLLVGMTSVFAQKQVNVSGRITDELNEPMIGVSVLEKGTTNGVITDLDGNYALSASEGSTIVFSYIGYVTQEKKAVAGTMNIILKEDSKTLDEVVVVGYGVQKKSSVTGAISSVKAEDFENRTITNAEQALQGKTAGVQIISASAAPGSNPAIRIRGYSSNASSDPLYVVDGLRTKDISNLDPNDIESMEVLKDAASAAIYGAQAGNGVVLITTRKAKKGVRRISYDFQLSSQSLGRTPDILNAQEYVNYMTEGNLIPRETIDRYWDGKTNTDWIEETFESSMMQRHNVNFQGANDNGSLFASLSYLSNNGPIVGNKDVFDRITGTVNADYKIKDWLKFTTNNSFSRYHVQSVSEGSATGSLMLSAIQLDPLTPVTYAPDKLPDTMINYMNQGHTLLQNANGDYYSISPYGDSNNINPYIMRDRGTTKRDGFVFSGSTYLDFTPIKELVITSRLGYRYTYSNSYGYVMPNITCSDLYQDYVSVSATSSNTTYWQWENFANYTKTFADKHNVNVMLGMSYSSNTSFGVTGGINGSRSGDKVDLGITKLDPNYAYFAFRTGTATRTVSGGEKRRYANLSYFGRASYDYAGKYFAQFTLRADAADLSILPLQKRWGYFPAVSVGWRISDEKFMKGLSWIDDLKVRYDYGVTGNQEIGNYQSLATYKAYGWYQYGGNNFHVWGPSKNVNSELRWEKGHNQNIGLDFSLFKHKVTGSFNYFHRKQSDLLGSYSVSVPPNLFSTIYANVGTLRNTGFELDITVNAVRTKDFTYSFTLVGATNNNKFVSFSNDVYKGQKYYSTCNMANPNNPGYLQRIEEGERIGNYFTYRYAGVDKKGDWLIYDKKGNVIPVSQGTEEDKAVTGNGLPKFTGSMTHNFTYKNFDLTVALRGAAGFDIFNVHDFYFGLQSMSTNQLTTAYSKNAHITTGKNVITDYFIEPGDYLKIDNITLGYTMNLNKKYIEKIRLFGTANNLYTFTKFTGVDPSTYEVNGLTPGTFGGGYNYYPSAFQFILGLQVSF